MSSVPAPDFSRGRHAGVLVPLFSLPSTRSWGIGELADLPVFARWLASAGLDLLQVLPVNEMAEGQNSPYSAITAMAIDPIYISLADVPEFIAAGGEDALPPDARDRLAQARHAPRVDYASVRFAKQQAFERAFERFERDAQDGSPRAEAFEAFRRAEGWWLEDYGLFRALHAQFEGRPWWEWPEELRHRDPRALDEVRSGLARTVRFRQFLQWLANEQWVRARASMSGVGLFGDLPFMVGRDSADVWARQDEFDIAASVGTPPDAFSETGQDWGLPAYRWDVLAARDFDWLRDRARRGAELYSGYRVDHLVGFYRTYVRPPEGKPYFVPADEAGQLAQGERIMRLFAESGPQIIAEDLGTVPDFVRESLARLNIPGYRVLRWERAWKQEGQPFHDPASWPARSVATSGTHDTDPLVVWWEEAPAEEREALCRIPAIAASGIDPRQPKADATIRDALLHTIYASGSDLLIVPLQDLFGWPDRINTPATIGDENWTWRLPAPVDRWVEEAEPRERAATLREWARETGRQGAQ